MLCPFMMCGHCVHARACPKDEAGCGNQNLLCLSTELSVGRETCCTELISVTHKEEADEQRKHAWQWNCALDRHYLLAIAAYRTRAAQPDVSSGSDVGVSRV